MIARKHGQPHRPERATSADARSYYFFRHYLIQGGRFLAIMAARHIEHDDTISGAAQRAIGSAHELYTSHARHHRNIMASRHHEGLLFLASTRRHFSHGSAYFLYDDDLIDYWDLRWHKISPAVDYSIMPLAGAT